MANEIKLEVYTIKIRQKGDDKHLSIHDTFGDIATFVSNFIKSNDTMQIDESHKKSIQFNTKKLSVSEKQNFFSGIIESGDYGTESEIKDMDTGALRYHKRKNDLDVKPFYFLFWLPATANAGFIFLQRTGVFGINTLFSIAFRNYVRDISEAIHVSFNPFVSKSLAKSFLKNGTLKEISLSRYNLPTDVADRLGFSEFKEDIHSIELIIRSKGGFRKKSRMQKFMDNSDGKFFDFPALEEIGMDGKHKEKIKVNLGGNTRTIDLSDTLQIKPYFEIDYVEKDPKSGHPIFESIDSIAKQFAEDIKREIL